MKIKSLICAGLLVTMVLSGCSGTTGKKEETGKIELSIAEWPQENKPASVAIYEEYVKIMNEKYPEIEIIPDAWVYDVNSFLPKAASGDLPTIFKAPFTEPKKIINSGYVREVTDFVKKLGYEEGTNPDLLPFMKYDDEYYGIINTAYKLGMAYNLKLFEQAGMLDENGLPKYPKTYDELVEMAVEIKEKTGKPGYFITSTKNQGGWLFMNIAWSYGVDFMEQVDGKWKATFNSPEGVAALQFVKDLKWKHNIVQDNVLADISEFAKLFATDQVAMGISNFTLFDTMINDYKMSKDNIAFSSMPGGPGGRATVAGGSLVLFESEATDEQIDAAFKWLELSGMTPSVNDEIRTSVENNAQVRFDEGKIVGVEAMPIYVSPERTALENEVNSKFANVDVKMFEDYLNNKEVELHVEEPVNTQELYKALDSVIQAVLTDEAADCQKLLDTAAADFQRDYLDKVN